jgi:hypothetical protein
MASEPMGDDMSMEQPQGSGNDKPFDTEPFDAGVEADEETDPKKFIEQLTGKLGQSLRKYNENQGQPDLELEKFAINSLLSATHTDKMDGEDKKDIVNRVENGSGDDESGDTSALPEEPVDDTQEPVSGEENLDFTGGDESGGEEPLNEMSLNDHNAQALVALYDNGDDNIKRTITRLVSFTDKLNRDIFIKDLYEDVDYEDIEVIMKRLKEMGIYTEPKISTFESIMLDNPPKNSMFQPNSNDKLEDDMSTKIHERLNILKKNSTFVEKDMEPVTKPKIKPVDAPIKPNRKSKPFLPSVTPNVNPRPKAMNEKINDYEVYNKTLGETLREIQRYVVSRGFDQIEFENHDVAHVNYGKTHRIQKVLSKGGVETKKGLNVQIYRMDSGNYELNMYVG